MPRDFPLVARHTNLSQIWGVGHSTGRSWVAWVTYGVLFMGMFLASVAFAEQIDLFEESSTQDEEALSCLAMALVEDGPTSVERCGCAAQTITPVELSPLLNQSACFSSSVPVRGSPKLRTHQGVSIYRI
jgi:hypothetical protein